MIVEKESVGFLDWLLGGGWQEAGWGQWVFSIALFGVLASVFVICCWVLTRASIARPKQSRPVYAWVGGLVVLICILILRLIPLFRYADFIPKETAEQLGLEWLLLPGWEESAIVQWLTVLAMLGVVATLLGAMVVTVRRGPAAAVVKTGQVLARGAVDLFAMSPRRVVALTKLAIKESIRRRVLVVFVVFCVILLFAGLFLNPASENPGRLYLNFVMTAATYLVLVLAVFLSTLSLPGDIRSRTLHTVVTKPVRASEIVMGRILGFTAVGTALLVMMCFLSYAFVWFGLRHTHELTAADLKLDSESEGTEVTRFRYAGQTSQENKHRHTVGVDLYFRDDQYRSSRHWVDVHDVHTHGVDVRSSSEEDRFEYEVGSPELVARVPVYGKLHFRDSKGFDKGEGINVGDEWTYRSYIAGAEIETAAIWTFEGVREKDFQGLDKDDPVDDEIVLEMTLGVFRTHKGTIVDTVAGSIWMRNPKTGLTVAVVPFFRSQEFSTQRKVVGRRIPNMGARVVARKNEVDGEIEMTPPQEQLDQSLKRKREFDLFEDLVADGKVEIWLQCHDRGQYIGAAQADLYIVAPKASSQINFVKGYLGIWLQMVMIISIGVMFSTFLSGPVATIATLGWLVGGMFRDFMVKVALGESHGGGPMESMHRIVMQENLITDLDPGLWTDTMQMVDAVFRFGLRLVSYLLPPLSDFDFTAYVAYGFDVPLGAVLIRTVHALAFLVPVFIAGYLFLGNREVAR